VSQVEVACADVFEIELESFERSHGCEVSVLRRHVDHRVEHVPYVHGRAPQVVEAVRTHLDHDLGEEVIELDLGGGEHEVLVDANVDIGMGQCGEHTVQENSGVRIDRSGARIRSYRYATIVVSLRDAERAQQSDDYCKQRPRAHLTKPVFSK
jgi:hypothetical protein